LIAAAAVALLMYGLELAGVGLPIPCVAPSYVVGGTSINQLRIDVHFVPPCFIFMLAIVFGQEVPGLPQTTCFLDKCCIHQTDPDLKMQGIQQLGGFLRSSRRLVILWQPEYLTRLWCAYELAAFHYIHDDLDGLIDLVPLKLPLLTMCLFCFHFVASLACAILVPLTVFSEWHARWMLENISVLGHVPYLFCVVVAIFFFGLYLIPGFFLWKFCMWHMDDRKTLMQQLRSFRVDALECYDTADRDFVAVKINTWFGSVTEFERLVRNDVARLVERKLADRGPMPWTMLFVGSLSHVFFSLSISIDLALRSEWQLFVRTSLVCVSLSCFTDAIAMNVGLRLADTSFGRGSRFAGPLVVAVVFSLLNGLVLITLCTTLPLWIDVFVSALLGVLTWLLYGGWRRFVGDRPRPKPQNGALEGGACKSAVAEEASDVAEAASELGNASVHSV